MKKKKREIATKNIRIYPSTLALLKDGAEVNGVSIAWLINKLVVDSKEPPVLTGN